MVAQLFFKNILITNT